MRLGALSKLYVNTGTYDAPTWLEVFLVSDLNVNAAWDEDESSTRLSRVKTAEQTMMGLELSGKMRKEILNTAFLAIRASVNAATTLDVLILDGSTALTGSDGYRSHMRVFNFGEDQSLGKVIFKEFSMKPCVGFDDNGDEVFPTSALVTAPGTLAYGAIG